MSPLRVVRRTAASLLTLLAAVLCLTREAAATPAFARQTGQTCARCHITFPELTPFGRTFKANAYTLSTEKAIKDKQGTRSILDLVGAPPLAAMLQISYTHVSVAQPVAAGQPPAQNDNVLFPQQFSFFYTGKIAPGLGAFIQITYDGMADHFSFDNTDIRYALPLHLFSKELVLGLTLNNNPTVSDLWNSTPAWGFPLASSPVGPSPTASTKVAGGFAQLVGGLGIYAFWNELVYVEGDIYRSMPLGVPQPLDAGTGASNVVAGVAPYWRLAIQPCWGNQSWEIGTFGMTSAVYPGGSPMTPIAGPTNRYTDYALDTQYQYIGDNHIFSAEGSWIHENQFLNASKAEGTSAVVSHDLNQLNLSAGYWYQRLLGLRLTYFSVNGNADPTLYAAAPLTGSSNGSPWSSGLVSELDFQPWLNTKLTLQYTTYFDFNGSKFNYDGSGRDASNNNTVYVLAWLSY